MDILAAKDGQTGDIGAVKAVHNSAQVATKLPYQYVPSGSSAQLLGAAGAKGDFIHRLILVVDTAATAQVQIKDGVGGTLREIFPANPGSGIGTYPVTLNLESASGGWYITTGAGVAVWAVGSFT